MKNKFNILLVVTGLPDAATPARSVFNLRYAEELLKSGNEVTILYLRAIKPGRSLLRVSKINEIDVFEVSVIFPNLGIIKRTTPLTSFFNYAIRKNKLADRLKYIEIVHAVHRGAMELSYLVSRNINRPLISQFIGGDLENNIPYLWKRKNFIKAIEHSSFLCFNSKGLEKTFSRNLNGSYKTEVLYRGVKLNDFRYTFKKSSTINVLFLGGFPGNTNLKGGKTLIQAIEYLSTNRLSKVVRFTIGGPNSMRYKSSLKSISNGNILIDFIGAVEKDVVREKMKDSHVVVIPSLAEGLPNILYEAMSSGNMVIATKVGGIPEILEDNRTGKLIAPDDPTALMHTLKNSIEGGMDYIEGFAKNGRTRIEKFGHDNFINGYLNIYHRSLENSHINAENK